MRLRGFNYGSRGAYFVTVVNHGRRCLYGHVTAGRMILSAAGRMVEGEIHGIERTCEGVVIDEAVVMPNHVHILLSLRAEACAGGTTLGSVVGAWKSKTTRLYKARAAAGEFAPVGAVLWQRGYYDHIVWDPEDFQRIRWYIRTNPERWCVDRDNPRPGL